MQAHEKNQLIRASAGSGKTYRLSNRFIRLCALGAAPESIVALTFTRKAAGEFAESILGKLARAAASSQDAQKIANEIAVEDVDFTHLLGQVVRALPRMTLSTNDGFFAKIVRAFQYDLGVTGGRFQVLDTNRESAEKEQILAQILSDTREDQAVDEFIKAFRRTTIGKEGVSVAAKLQEFVKTWQKLYRQHVGLEWGPQAFEKIEISTWNLQRGEITRDVLDAMESMPENEFHKHLKKFVENCAAHSTGSGIIDFKNKIPEQLLDHCSRDLDPLEICYNRKVHSLPQPLATKLRAMLRIIADAELAAAVQRTRAIYFIMVGYDALCEKQLRKRGLLGYDDVKFLMGRWTQTEDQRLRREAIDFQLDAKFQHWLLDEFQDTSHDDWLGLSPLIEEAITDPDQSTFIVGDRKQAIYGWRGGDVTLFDRILDKYGSVFSQESLTTSYRSSPAVLDLVNAVCGDQMTIKTIFGEAANDWQWQDHVASNPNLTGEAIVYEIEKGEDALEEAVFDLLDRLQVQKRAMSCCVLVRDNESVKKWANALRAAGHQVVEDGARCPISEDTVGVLLNQLVCWLDDPSNEFARRVIEMSPLADRLLSNYGQAWNRVWEKLHEVISSSGWAGMMHQVCDEFIASWPPFSKRCAQEILQSLADFDQQATLSAADARSWLKRLVVNEAAGSATIQVMTIHKSKGLGFDVVIIPQVPKEKIPNSGHFEFALSDACICDAPPQWVRKMTPEIKSLEEAWEKKQGYEAMCLLYVAITRAKRGLYLFLEKPAKADDADKATLVNWLRSSFASHSSLLDGIIYHAGISNWFEEMPLLDLNQPEPKQAISLRPAAAPMQRRTPSGEKSAKHAPADFNAGGKAFGNAVHLEFENIGWIDETGIPQNFSDREAGAVVVDVLKDEQVAHWFQRRGRMIRLFHEQAIDAMLDGAWMSGVIDRLHLETNASGDVARVEVLDYKTDAVQHASELLDRYTKQLEAYRAALALIFPNAEITCVLISTRHRCALAF
ncbi:MAG: hypothetical protein EAZ42_08600 [Verrucomicrobia bacterium]|nr:MAG: hypothetical protein EAZ42_08600 [Verrucomicrobiota bacterium]